MTPADHQDASGLEGAAGNGSVMANIYDLIGVDEDVGRGLSTHPYPCHRTPSSGFVPVADRSAHSDQGCARYAETVHDDSI
jgi:hypothetical protein